MFDHVGLEVADLERSAAFYDAIFFALGVRRMFEGERVIGYGVNDPRFWITARGHAPQAQFGHVTTSSVAPYGTERRRWAGRSGA